MKKIETMLSNQTKILGKWTLFIWKSSRLRDVTAFALSSKGWMIDLGGEGKAKFVEKDMKECHSQMTVLQIPSLKGWVTRHYIIPIRTTHSYPFKYPV